MASDKNINDKNIMSNNNNNMNTNDQSETAKITFTLKVDSNSDINSNE